MFPEVRQLQQAYATEIIIAVSVAAGLGLYDLMKDAADFMDRIVRAAWRKLHGK